MKVKDLTGQRFGRLTVVRQNGFNKNHNAMWMCECDCGNIVTVRSGKLQDGTTKSCGCLRRELKTTHGMTQSRIHGVWCAMKARCYNENSISYKNYGGRGISVCDEWKNFEPFYEWAIENGYDEMAKRGEFTIDRIDVNGDYSPSNCRWLDIGEQQRHRRNNHIISYNGKEQTASRWAEEVGISRALLIARISKLNWSIEKALTTPVRVKNNIQRIGERL